MEKEIILKIDKKFEDMANDITDDELFSVLGGYVKFLCCLCEKNDLDIQIDIYGSSNNNTTISYDYTYENAD